MGFFSWMLENDVKELLVGCFICVVVGGLAIIYPINLIQAGVVTEFEGKVQMVNRNNFIMPKTYVVLQTYAGENDEFTLAGYHDFEVGQQYRIKYVNKLYFMGLWVLGDLQEAEIRSSG